jgi:hypothetical protein
MPRIEISLLPEQLAILTKVAEMEGKSVEDLLVDCATGLIDREKDRARMAETMPILYALSQRRQK